MTGKHIENRKRYSSEFKEEVLRDSDIYGVKVTAEKHGIPVHTVYSWRKTVHRPEKQQDKPLMDIRRTIDRTLREINKALDMGQGDSKPHEWLGKLTVQCEKLVQLHQSMSGVPGKITEERVIHHASVDDRISRYLEAITERRDYIDADTTES